MKNAGRQDRKIGLREIAAVAKVSVATVSRVLNGNNRVDPAIQAVVLHAAAKLDVDLSQRNKTKALAFLLGNRAMQHAYHSRILLGAEACCASHGWDMIFLSVNYQPQASWKEIHLPRVVERQDVVRGVVLAGTNSTNLIELLLQKGITFVVLGNNVIGELQQGQYDVVTSNDIQGGFDMTRYLLGLGHRHVWFVGNTKLPWFARCFEGYRRAMEEAGFEPRQSHVDSEDETEIGYLGSKSILARGEPVTAIFAGNDPTAHGVYRGLRDSGLRIPDDVSVAGCDDTVGGWLHPGLTTLREFPEQLGKQMVELAISRIGHPNQPHQHISVPTELIKRDSCSPIPLSVPLPREPLTESAARPLVLPSRVKR
jgi:DNA-binding LacI/PurR family transcriptional regulator